MPPPLTLGLLLAPAALGGEAGACDRRPQAAEVVELAVAAEAAFTDLDMPAFLQRRREMGEAVQCAAGVLQPGDVARVHRVQALAAFSEKDSPRVAQALGGLYAAAAGSDIPLDLLPAGHPIRAQEPPARGLAGNTAVVALPSDALGRFVVDGLERWEVPAARAAVVQQVGTAGEVLATRYAWPGDDLGGWERDHAQPSLGALYADAAAPTENDLRAPPGRLGRALEPSPFAATARVGGFAAFRAGGFLGEFEGVYALSRHAQVLAGGGFWTLARHYSRDEREVVAEYRGVAVGEVGVDEWNTLVPFWVGIRGLTGQGRVRGSVGYDAVACVIGEQSPPAWGGRVHLGVEFRATPTLAGAAGVAGGLLFNEEFPLYAAGWAPIEPIWAFAVGGTWRP